MALLLDMDGVIVDFQKSALRAHGLTVDDIKHIWPPGVWDLDKVLGMTTDEFFEKIEATPDFWSNLEPYPWADDLHNRLQKMMKVVFCTSPTYCPNSVSGKVRWLQRWKGRTFRDFIITPKKEELAGNGNILIDDSDRNVEKFRKAGGSAVLFPSYSNSLYHYASDAVDYTITEVRHLLSKNI